MKAPRRPTSYFFGDPPKVMTTRRPTRAWTAIAWAQLLAAAATVPAIPAIAQQIPDAGSMQRQTEQERRPALPPAAAPSPAPGPAATPERAPATGPTLRLSAFRFEGNTLLSSEVLSATVAAYLQRPVRLVELEGAAALLAQRYREEGWLARVLIPPQDEAVIRLNPIGLYLKDFDWTAQI